MYSIKTHTNDHLKFLHPKISITERDIYSQQW